MRIANPPQSQYATTQCAIARGASAPGLKCFRIGFPLLRARPPLLR